MPTDLKAVELRLRAILERYRDHLVEDTIYSMPVLRRKGAKKHDWFAGVQPVEGAVKFNFLPMHGNKALLEDAPPELVKHKTGASVFKFKEIDEHLATALEAVVAKGFLAYMGTRTMADFRAVEARLRSIFDPYRDQFITSKDGPDGLYLETPGYEGTPWGYVGGTRLGKAYVSFYLMGVYDGGLQSAMSPELRKRMQGKTCFNFTKIDEDLFAELEDITAKAVARHPQVVAEALAARKARKAAPTAR